MVAGRRVVDFSGVRPNSPVTNTVVDSKSPFADRGEQARETRISGGKRLSLSLLKLLSCVSQPPC